MSNRKLDRGLLSVTWLHRAYGPGIGRIMQFWHLSFSLYSIFCYASDLYLFPCLCTVKFQYRLGDLTIIDYVVAQISGSAQRIRSLTVGKLARATL